MRIQTQQRAANGGAGFGGGIQTSGGSLTLNNSAVIGNWADAAGGGGGIISFSSVLILNNSTVSGNTTTNTTVAGTQSSGGGIYANEGSVTLNSSTISGNSANHGTGVGGLGGGIFNHASSSTIVARNSIVAGNTASLGGPDCSGALGSAGYNLLGNTAGCGFGAGPGDLLNVAARTIALRNVHALLLGSPAIDGGNPAGCLDHLGQPLPTDQRGKPRPLVGDANGSAVCDIGAYELDPNDPVRQVFLPVLRRPRPGISGEVTHNGAPLAGVALELRFYNGSTFSTLATTMTGQDGGYVFTGIPSLAPGQSYYVRYLNTTGATDRLWVWGTHALTAYTAGSIVGIGNFDLANIVLVAPAPGTTVALPFTFQWTPRPATPTDNYEFNLGDFADLDPYFYTEVGYVSGYTVHALPPGFSPGAPVLSEVWVYSPDGGYGISYETRVMTFSNFGASASDTAAAALERVPRPAEAVPRR